MEIRRALRLRRRPHRGIEYTSDDELPMLGGHLTAMEHPWIWGAEVEEKLAAELEEQLARKKPLGFAAWPDE